MTILGQVAGSFAGLTVIAVCVILVAHLTHLPKFSHPWVLRVLIVLTYGGGTLVAYTGLGSLWATVATDIAGVVPGGLHGQICHAVIVVVSVIVILGLVIALWKAPTEAAVLAAALVPAVLMLSSYGFIHGFWTATSAPAQQFAAQFLARLGG